MIVKTQGGSIEVCADSNLTMEVSRVRVCDFLTTCFGEVVEVMGTAPILEGCKEAGKEAIWYQKDDGLCYYFAPGNLFYHGFKEAHVPPD